MSTWHSDDLPEEPRIGFPGMLRALVRATLMIILIYGLLMLFWIVRLVEAPFKSRRFSPRIVQWACRGSLWILGIPLRTQGEPMSYKGAVVSNHSSWLDIFTLNSRQRVFFVSKSEVSKWPGIGVLARSTGTVFIERKATHAHRHKSQFEERLSRADKLLFFPEGTSTDSQRVLPFKSSLFAAFFEPHLVETMWIQPMTVRYRAPVDQDPRFYGWWGDMSFGPHLIKTLASGKRGSIDVVFHDPVRVSDFECRKALAQYCETKVREALVF